MRVAEHAASGQGQQPKADDGVSVDRANASTSRTRGAQHAGEEQWGWPGFVCKKRWAMASAPSTEWDVMAQCASPALRFFGVHINAFATASISESWTQNMILAI